MSGTEQRVHLVWGSRGRQRPASHPANMDQRPDRHDARDVPTRVPGVLSYSVRAYQSNGGSA